MEIGTPQAWRDDLEWLAAERDARAWIELPERPEPAVAIFAAAKAAVAARDRELSRWVEPHLMELRAAVSRAEYDGDRASLMRLFTILDGLG